MEKIKKEDFLEISEIIEKQFPDYSKNNNILLELIQSKLDLDISRKIVDSNGKISELLIFTNMKLNEELETGSLNLLINYYSIDCFNKPIKGIYLLWIREDERGKGNSNKWFEYIKNLKTDFWVPVLDNLNTHNLWINKFQAKFIINKDNCTYYYINQRKFSKRYVVIYVDVKAVTTVYGTKSYDHNNTFFETDDLSEYNDLLDLVKNTSSKNFQIIGLDILKQEIIYSNSISTRNIDKFKLLEKYIGNNKIIYDFYIKKELNEDPDYKLFRYQTLAEKAYERYLRNEWSNDKKEIIKSLPKVQKEDDPYMTKFELIEREKEDKEKLEKYD